MNLKNAQAYPIDGRMPLFTRENRELVRSGAKTQTRRVIKPQPFVANCGEITGPEKYLKNGRTVWNLFSSHCLFSEVCPHGKTGDIRVMPEPLQCREVWSDNSQFPEEVPFPVVGYADGGPCFYPLREWQWKRDTLSSMFMPKIYGRVLVRYTRIWVERLQDISEADAKAEGAIPSRLYSDMMLGAHSYNRYLCAYHDIWDSINGKAHPWKSNPWVWCIEWELLSTEVL